MRKYKSFTAILLTAALVSSVTACSRNAAQTDSSVEASESTSGISSSGNDTITEAEETEETMAASSEEETEESTAAAETSGTEATAEEQSETEETSEDASEETTKASETTKAPETSKAPQTTKASETTKAALKPQSITASVSGTHYVGDTLTGADFTVTVTMSDGSTLTNPAGWSASPLTLSSTSNQITVAYEGVSSTITVQASERPVTIPTQPSQTATTAAQVATTASMATAATQAQITPQYITAVLNGEHYVGETVTASDFTVTVTMSDGSTLVNPSGVTVNPTTLSAGNCLVQIWYGDLYCGYVTDTIYPYADQTYIYEMAFECFELQNQYRIEVGVEPLVWSGELYTTACERAVEIITDFSHNGMRNCRGENILLGRYDTGVADIMERWKASTGHYENLTKAGYTYGAIACYYCAGYYYVVALFK